MGTLLVIFDYGLSFNYSHGDTVCGLSISNSFRSKLRGALLAICDFGTSSCSKKSKGDTACDSDFGAFSLNRKLRGTLLVIRALGMKQTKGQCL